MEHRALFEHELIDVYSFAEIPINEECCLIDERYMNEFYDVLLKMLNGGDYRSVGYISYVVARKIFYNSVELSWYPNIYSRFHEVSITLPKDRFKICAGCWRYDIKPYIFVDHEWLERLFTREYSVFSLVDAIGVRAALRDQVLTEEKLILLRKKIDQLAEQYQEISFISLADSLILKSNWSVGYFRKSIKCSYEPEAFIRVVKELQAIYRKVLNLEIYAILTQGMNEYYKESLLHISHTRNHICLNCLGIPFAELLAIERSVKSALKCGIHPPAELYMDGQYYHSLNFKFGFNKNDGPRNKYKAIMRSGENNYFYASCDKILDNLE